MNILVQVTGSISVYKICEVVSRLVKLNHSVKVCASNNSLKFIGSAVWEGLSGNKVYSDDFAPGQRMEHINLNKWADLTLLAPASAKTINQLSLGVGDGVINTLFLARDQEKPFLIFPAMNPKMWSAPSLQKSLLELEKHPNLTVFEPESGLMACGDTGSGRLREPVDIVSECLKYNKFTKKALVTFGGTRESIDGVREITNFSTGSTGLRLIDELSKSMSVTAFYADRIEPDFACFKKYAFSSANDLQEKLQNTLLKNHYDVVYHLAAVSDYTPIEVFDKKLDSSSDEALISLKRTEKILPKIKLWSKNKDLKVVSFKLTHNQSDEVVSKKINDQLKEESSDFVVHNTLKGSRGSKHSYQIFSEHEKRPVFEGCSKNELVEDLRNVVFESKGELSC